MRFLPAVVVFGWLISCSGVSSPGPHHPLTDSPETNIDAAPGDAAPVESPSTVNASPVPDAAASPHPLPRSTVRGWYCHELRRKPGDDEYMSDCSRTLNMCDSKRKSGIRQGGHVTDCRRVDSAFCYHVRNDIEVYYIMVCADTVQQCRNQQMIQRQIETDVFTDCELTE